MRSKRAAILGKHEKIYYLNLAKVGVEGSNPFARSNFFPQFVIPGRTEGANPESRNKLSACIWIPGPALRAVPE